MTEIHLFQFIGGFEVSYISTTIEVEMLNHSWLILFFSYQIQVNHSKREQQMRVGSVGLYINITEPSDLVCLYH